jgi:hypothetical protein
MSRAQLGAFVAAFGPIALVATVPIVVGACTADSAAADSSELVSQDVESGNDQSPEDSTSDTLDTPLAVSATAPAHFRHPGVLFNGAQLDFVRAKVRAGAQPWKDAYDKLAQSEYASMAWKAKPRATVNCGPRSNPNEGCSDERRDAMAAYAHALLWYFNDDAAHAQKAIEIFDAWSSVIKTHTGHNAPLQTGWSASVFPLAAEIIRHTYSHWSAASVARFEAMLRSAYLPTVRVGNAGANGNWELIMTEATFAISVFLEDKSAFDTAAALWRRRVPAYIYLSSDGPYPKGPTSKLNSRSAIVHYWQGQSTFVDGLAQETCRDLGHTQWGIGAAIAGAETAYQQGVDLYHENADRLVKGLEFQAQYMMGQQPPSWLCGGKLQLSDIPTWEIGYNHFHNRLGLALPHSQQFITQKERTETNLVNYFIGWETLTHAAVGKVGL